MTYHLFFCLWAATLTVHEKKYKPKQKDKYEAEERTTKEVGRISFINKIRAQPLIKKKAYKKKGGGLHIRLSTILMPLLLRSPSLSIQGVGCLVPCAFALARGRDKLHLLGVTTFIFGSLTLVHIVEVGLKVTVLLKLLGQRCQDLAYQHGPVGSLVPWPGPPFLLPRPPQPRPSQYRVTSPSSLRHSVAALTPWANASTIATSSSVTSGRSELLGVARSQDLTKSWTSENLSAESALKKLVDGHEVLREESSAV
ncbi:hypothetical protein Cgig2_020627 [Carnegiea gigantea]|uniref:Uncharacterized protein n=1 Tax=Carnegiea gigantea TaxID=171969 RepID=A0A9Q1JY93_9CARY|nr:hypothetical protein Cgig2_020627 [Carnegiea gigantea]